MPTTRWTVACASLLLALTASAQDKKPEDPKKPKEPPKAAELVVPSGAAVEVDGKIGDDGLKGGVHFAIRRGRSVLGDVWLLRHKRQLYISCRSKLAANALGVRFTLIDLASGRKMLVLITPMNPPRSPLSIYRHLPNREATSVAPESCDVRFDLSGKEGFDMELRVPLDLLEIARAKKGYWFTAEFWDVPANRMIAGYPITGKGPVAGRGRARLSPEGDWGADVALNTVPPPINDALALLEKVQSSRSTGGGMLQIYTGHVDGQRKDGPLEKLEAELHELIKRYPDYLSLQTNLVRVLRARNRFDETLRALDAIPTAFPFMAGNKANALARLEVFYVSGRFEEAIKVINDNKKLFVGPEAKRLRGMLSSLLRNWKLEQAMRAEEAKRDDLPRVRFTTNRGSFVMELFEDDSPNGVANMIQLVENGFYDGTRFHWVSGGGRVVGGDPKSRDKDPYNDGYGDPGYLIESEPGRRLQFPFTVAFSDKRHKKRTEGCAFMIHITPLPGLDGTNTVIGRIIEGKDVVMALEYYDTIQKTEVVRKRAHDYRVIKR